MAEDERSFRNLEVNIQEIVNQIIRKLHILHEELKVGLYISEIFKKIVVLVHDSNEFDNFFHFTKVGEGGFGTCFKVTPKENAPKELACFGEFLVKELKESTDQQELVDETAWVLFLTLLGHYGITESHVVKHEYNGIVQEGPLVLFRIDSSQNITSYIAMKYIEGKQLSEALEKKELNDYDKLRIAVRIADTMSFLHGYKLAHCDLSCENIMLAQGTNDPILIDLGNVRTGEDFSSFDTSAYQALIYRMYRDCNVSRVPPILRPIFDKWDDEIHSKMSFKDVTDKYFPMLSAYHSMVRVVNGATQRSNIVPVRRLDCHIFVIDFEAMSKSNSFTEYMSQVGISLAEQDEKIKEYLKNF